MSVTETTRGPGEHRDRTAAVSVPGWPGDDSVGPIAVVPDDDGTVVEAVRVAGGEVGPLDGRTRGLIWMPAREPAELTRVLGEHPAISWVQLPLAGVDAFLPAIGLAAERPRVWTGAKGAYAEPVAEHALTLTLATLRHLPDKARATAWEQQRRGVSLFGRSILVIGGGGIAAEFVRLVAPFQPRITVMRRTAQPFAGAHLTVTPDRLHEVLPDADVVVLAAASVAANRHMIGARELALLDPDAVIVNIARGALIDTDALVEALVSGRLAGAGIDVTDPEPLPTGHPLYQAPNTVVTMHTADTPAMIRPLIVERIRRNVAAFVGDGRFVGVIDPIAGY